MSNLQKSIGSSASGRNARACTNACFCVSSVADIEKLTFSRATLLQHLCYFFTDRLAVGPSHFNSVKTAKARFPLPELTARVNGDRFPLPVNTGRVDGRAVSTSRVDGPSTRLVETGLNSSLFLVAVSL